MAGEKIQNKKWSLYQNQWEFNYFIKWHFSHWVLIKLSDLIGLSQKKKYIFNK